MNNAYDWPDQVESMVETAQRRLSTFRCQNHVSYAGQRGLSVVERKCAFDGVALVAEAKASDDNDRDEGSVQARRQHESSSR